MGIGNDDKDWGEISVGLLPNHKIASFATISHKGSLLWPFSTFNIFSAFLSLIFANFCLFLLIYLQQRWHLVSKIVWVEQEIIGLLTVSILVDLVDGNCHDDQPASSARRIQIAVDPPNPVEELPTRGKSNTLGSDGQGKGLPFILFKCCQIPFVPLQSHTTPLSH